MLLLLPLPYRPLVVWQPQPEQSSQWLGCGLRPSPTSPAAMLLQRCCGSALHWYPARGARCHPHNLLANLKQQSALLAEPRLATFSVHVCQRTIVNWGELVTIVAHQPHLLRGSGSCSGLRALLCGSKEGINCGTLGHGGSKHSWQADVHRARVSLHRASSQSVSQYPIRAHVLVKICAVITSMMLDHTQECTVQGAARSTRICFEQVRCRQRSSQVLQLSALTSGSSDDRLEPMQRR